MWRELAVAGAIGLAFVATRGIADATEDRPLEDEPGWSCVDDGNRVCGPGNPEGKPAACYDDGGVIVALWPCEAWQPSDGWMHADGSLTCPERLPMINLWTGELSCHDESGPDWDYAYDYTN